jgi:hypothetical protein
MLRLLIASVTLALTASLAHAAATCDAQATEKKLAGAAKNSFVKKCNKDSAKSACAITAADKKLAGAAKNSFIKKCEKDAGAPTPAASK